MTMKLSTLLAALTLAWASLSQAEHVPVETLKWFDTGIGTMKAAVAYGDMSKGPYGVFLKFPGGFTSPVHHHSGDYRAVVISGTIVNSEVGETDITMQVGSYWQQHGKAPHVTKCVSDEGCTVFLTQTDKFDFLTEKDSN